MEYVTFTIAGCAVTVQSVSRDAEAVERIVSVHRDVVTPTVVGGTPIHL